MGTDVITATPQVLTTAQDWAAAIHRGWQDTVSAIIDVGRLLIEAKASLPGEFVKMAEEQLPFSYRTASMLMAIADNPHLTNRKHVSYLPSSWGTLYQLSRLPEPDLEEALLNGQIFPDMERRDVTELRRKLTRARGTAAPPSGKYRVIYADPPWSYGNSGLDDYGHAERHYDSMSIEALCELGDKFVKPACEENAVLFMWVTSPLLAECFEVIEAWGFTYKTSFVWDKVKHNFGHYNSVRHELLLICTKGSCTPDVLTLHDSVVEIERSERHSEKPEEFRKIIEGLYPKGKRLELFARKTVEGWDAWGNETATLTETTTKVS